MSTWRDAVVYVVAKAPRAGEVKTRLSPPLAPEEAARLAAAFLRDSIGVVRRAGAAVRLICPDEHHRVALERHAGQLPIDVQRGNGLGAALESAFALGFAAGYGRVAVLGADTPTLPARLVKRALAVCAGGDDVALGPAEDGGYYLLAARRVHAPLFRNMRWSTSDVAAETLRRARALGLRVHLMPEWQDVDDPLALERLRAYLGVASAREAPHTRETLRGIPTAARHQPAMA
jgi:rSAM/selenodomain-associated transferase 1